MLQPPALETNYNSEIISPDLCKFVENIMCIFFDNDINSLLVGFEKLRTITVLSMSRFTENRYMTNVASFILV